MTALELKRLQVEHQKVFAARMDLELRRDEQMESVKKLEESIEIQMKREEDLLEQIKVAKEAK